MTNILQNSGAQKGCRRPVARCHGIITPPPPLIAEKAAELKISALPRIPRGVARWRILSRARRRGLQTSDFQGH